MNINEHRVREFAHQIWESEGRPDGQAHRHWEMACRLAEESEENNPRQYQQQAAPQNSTVKHNDTDTINKPGKAKTKALKKTLDEANSKNLKGKTKRGTDPVKQNPADVPGATAMEGLPEPQSGPEKISFAKSGNGKSPRVKNSKLIKDVVNTELSPVNSGIVL